MIKPDQRLGEIRNHTQSVDDHPNIEKKQETRDLNQRGKDQIKKGKNQHPNDVFKKKEEEEKTPDQIRFSKNKKTSETKDPKNSLSSTKTGSDNKKRLSSVKKKKKKKKKKKN